MAIPAQELEEVHAARCTACMECVESCPTRGKRTLALRFPAGGRRPLARGAVAAILMLALGAAVAGAVLAPLPSFTWTRGTEPPQVEALELRLDGLTCRGRANLLVYMLNRDDDLEIEGYVRLLGWPEPGAARARIEFDPDKADATAVRDALTEPYYDRDTAMWRMSPFRLLE